MSRSWMVFLFIVSFGYFVQPMDIDQASRTINLETQLTKISYSFKFTASEKAFLFDIEPLHAQNVSHIEASVKGKGLEIKLRRSMPNKQYEIDIEKFVGKEINLSIKAVFFLLQRPKPAEIIQTEKQFVKFHANSFIYSSYFIKSQTSSVTLPQTQLLMHTAPEKPSFKVKNVITYGMYKDVSPYSESVFVVHYETSSSFLTITNLHRAIELSHWGNIAVEEHIDINHSGAKLKGGFSRLDFQRGYGLQSVVRHWNTLLPPQAENIYYRDAIGNVSTSSVTNLYSAIDVEIRPRFPLFGGWKTQYILGYSLPTYEYLYVKGNKYTLKMRMMDHIHNNQFVVKGQLKIVLPEGVQNVKLNVPFDVKRLPDTNFPTYLDTTGRIVLNLEMENLVSQHIKDFTVTYEFDSWKLAREFVMVIAAYFILFMTVIIYVRLDFSISKNEKNDMNEKAQAMVDEISRIFDKICNKYQAYEECLTQYRIAKDGDALESVWKSVGNSLKSLQDELLKQKNFLKSFWTEGSDKLSNFQDLSSNYVQYLNELKILNEKLVNGDFNKQQFQQSEQDICNKKMGVMNKMEALINGL